MLWFRRISLLAFLLASVGAYSAPPTDMIIGQASVIDGDTIEIHSRRIRLDGIDAPESRQLCQDATGEDYRCGQVASFALADRIGRHTVICDNHGTDRYGRSLSYCSVGGADLGAWLVEQGLAVEYRRYSDGRYRAAEDRAKAAHAGLWGGTFEWPWEWRQNQKRKAGRQ